MEGLLADLFELTADLFALTAVTAHFNAVAVALALAWQHARTGVAAESGGAENRIAAAWRTQQQSRNDPAGSTNATVKAAIEKSRTSHMKVTTINLWTTCWGLVYPIKATT